MGKLKTEFFLEKIINGKVVTTTAAIRIIGSRPKSSPFVGITLPTSEQLFINDKEAEMLATNILKAFANKKVK